MKPAYKVLLSFIDNLNNDDIAEDDDVKCQYYNHYLFHQFTLIPAFLITLLFALTRKRRNILLNILYGRPGLIYPMDSLTRSARISYACAFGATADLVYNIVFAEKAAFDYNRMTSVKSFVAMASMFIYGMKYYPVFASLVIGSAFAYALGAIYMWMLSGVQLYSLMKCGKYGLPLDILDNLPLGACLIYLSLSIPFRMVLAFRKRRFLAWASDIKILKSLNDIKKSYVGHHVINLFKKTIIKRPSVGKKAMVLGVIQGFIQRFVYRSEKGFRYPSRVLSVIMVALLVIYKLTFMIMLVTVRDVDSLINAMSARLNETYGPEPQSDVQDGFGILLSRFIYLLEVTRACIITSVFVAVVITVLNILHILSSYRTNMRALYRGDHSFIPPASTESNTSHCINSLKYAGFQVGYIIWGYFLQVILLMVISLPIAAIIVFFEKTLLDTSLEILSHIWPWLFSFIFLLVVQRLLAKFVFLQEFGRVLALNNRSCYFNFSYFMFFYNIFIGLFSCLMRILKAMLLGVIFLSRLDISTLSRKFEFLDPGYRAYIGFLQMELAHTHPVVIVFCRLMLLNLHKRSRPTKELMTKEMKGIPAWNESQRELSFEAKPEDEDSGRKKMGGLFKWYVAYTLLHNPALRVFRKGYIQMMRQAHALGIYIPISDRQADIDVNEMMENIRKAKEQLANAGKENTDGNKLTENVTEVNLDCDSVDVTDAEKGTTGLLSGASEKDCDVKFRVSASKMPSLFKTEVTNISETEGKGKRKEDSNLFGMDAAVLNFRM